MKVQLEIKNIQNQIDIMVQRATEVVLLIFKMSRCPDFQDVKRIRIHISSHHTTIDYSDCMDKRINHYHSSHHQVCVQYISLQV